ncbi:helix-turn-helix domain-containing protein [Bradyrhizobium sp. HKCCYLRH3099]|uniref:helix-turn-helix domain-containing protein n=1 Tax=unclassified Bradyrhizobium TaxID=2631580 RepID=UPI003EBEBE73
MYHYKESGLDNIYLENGYRIQKTPYGNGVSIVDTEGLHRVIGQGLINVQKPLNGAELRFLRLEMDTTQKDLAAMLGTTEQSLRLWEKNRTKSLPGSSDRLLRALYADYIGGKGSVRRMLRRLSDMREHEQSSTFFQDKGKGWLPRDEDPPTAQAQA